MGDLDRMTWLNGSYYDALELPEDASPEEIRAAYRLLRVAWIPDRFDRAEWKQLAAERCELIEKAYRCLMVETSRTAYDAALTEHPPTELPQEFQIPFKHPAQHHSETWKRLASWMKERQVGTPFLRKMAYTAGDYIERRRAPSAKQLPHMIQAWEESLRTGFDPNSRE